MRMKKRKGRKQKFSVVKAVKANARRTVGQPRPERAIEDRSARPERKKKHKKTLGDLLAEHTKTDGPQ